MTSLSVILPAFNEERTLRRTVERVFATLERLGIDHEVIVVNDGSIDGTTTITAQLLQEHTASFHTVRHNKNRGYGAALRTGFLAAQKEFISFTDADGQVAFEALESFLPFADEHTVVLGYRVERHDPFFRSLNAWGWKMVVRAVLGLNVRDVDCALKLFPRSLLETTRLTSDGAFINAELLVLAKRRKFTFHELPVHHAKNESGHSTGAKPVVVFRAFRELARFLSSRKT